MDYKKPIDLMRDYMMGSDLDLDLDYKKKKD